MGGYVWKHLPYAIYLDTNALRAAGANLDAPWINELLSITNEYSTSVCISELVLAEWCEHIIEILKSHQQKLLSAVSLLKLYGIPVPDVKPEDISLPEKEELIKLATEMMNSAGLNIVPNWEAPLSRLIEEAVSKRPPFGKGGKGLCDVVIMESYATHAKKNFAKAKVLVVSNDNAVRRSDGRFKDREVDVDFVGESEIVEKLKSLLNNEAAAYLEHKKAKLKEHILTHESTILDFVRKTPLKITEWMLNPPLAKPLERISGTIESILSIRPIRIIDVIGGTPTFGEQTAEGRYPVQILVEIELDIVVSEYPAGLGLFMRTRAIVQPDMLDDKSPVTLQNSFDWTRKEFTRTIQRNLTVFATLDAEKEKTGTLDDFRIEKIV